MVLQGRGGPVETFQRRDGTKGNALWMERPIEAGVFGQGPGAAGHDVGGRVIRS
jgi:hypothetical protein